jgi:hypothetical protein
LNNKEKGWLKGGTHGTPRYVQSGDSIGPRGKGFSHRGTSLNGWHKHDPLLVVFYRHKLAGWPLIAASWGLFTIQQLPVCGLEAFDVEVHLDNTTILSKTTQTVLDAQAVLDN